MAPGSDATPGHLPDSQNLEKSIVPTDLEPYAAIGITILLVSAVAVVMLILAHTVGPKRRGPVKDSPYECGMPTIGGTHARFNVRFYIVAMLFLLFDVELAFMWPGVLAYYDAAANGATFALEDGTLVGKGFLALGLGFFFLLLLFGLIYEWKKGAFEWD